MRPTIASEKHSAGACVYWSVSPSGRRCDLHRIPRPPLLLRHMSRNHCLRWHFRQVARPTLTKAHLRHWSLPLRLLHICEKNQKWG